MHRPTQQWLDFSSKSIEQQSNDLSLPINNYHQNYPVVNRTVSAIPVYEIEKDNREINERYERIRSERHMGHLSSRGEIVERPIVATPTFIEDPVSTFVPKTINIDPFGLAKKYTGKTRQFPTVYHFLYNQYNNLLEIHHPMNGGNSGIFQQIQEACLELIRKCG